jgi:hypothetical protein
MRSQMASVSLRNGLSFIKQGALSSLKKYCFCLMLTWSRHIFLPHSLKNSGISNGIFRAIISEFRLPSRLAFFVIALMTIFLSIRTVAVYPETVSAAYFRSAVSFFTLLSKPATKTVLSFALTFVSPLQMLLRTASHLTVPNLSLASATC